MIDWEAVFDVVYRRVPGASKAALSKFVATVGRVNASQQNPFPPGDPLHAGWVPFDPARWRIPDRPIPASYLSFLRWSDGGEFQTGDRFGTAPEIADVVAFLASPDARWVTGELLGATGGLRG